MIKNIVLGVGVLMLLAVSAEAQNRGRRRPAPKELELKVGDVAPNWTMTGSDKKEYKLSDFKGEKGVVIAWYPAALTRG